jgi:hypothetical protein
MYNPVLVFLSRRCTQLQMRGQKLPKRVEGLSGVFENQNVPESDSVNLSVLYRIGHASPFVLPLLLPAAYTEYPGSDFLIYFS